MRDILCVGRWRGNEGKSGKMGDGGGTVEGWWESGGIMVLRWCHGRSGARKARRIGVLGVEWGVGGGMRGK